MARSARAGTASSVRASAAGRAAAEMRSTSACMAFPSAGEWGGEKRLDRRGEPRRIRAALPERDRLAGRIVDDRDWERPAPTWVEPVDELLVAAVLEEPRSRRAVRGEEPARGRGLVFEVGRDE